MSKTAPDSSIPSALRPLVGWALARPKRAMTLLALTALAAAPGLLRLELRTDGQALQPRNDPAIRFDAAVRERFGLRDPVVAMIETDHPRGVLNEETLRRVEVMTRALAAMPEFAEPGRLFSLATERRDRVVPGTLEFRPYLDPFPDNDKLMGQLGNDLDAADILTGTLISADRRATVILAGAPLEADQASLNWRRDALFHRIEALAREIEGGQDRISVVGAPVAETLLGEHILEDLTLLLPLSIAAIALALWLSCRSLWAVALGMAEVGACLIFTFGLMGWLGVPVFLTTAVLPVILTTIGLADEIHILWRYQRDLDTEDARPVHATMGAMARPVALTSLTTAIGFLSFLSSPLEAVRAFGWFAPVGVLFCMFWSLMFTPAALRSLPRSALRRGRPASRAWTSRLAPAYRRRGATLAALAVATAALGMGVAAIYVQDSWIDGFAPRSDFRQATNRVNAQFHGVHLLHAHLTVEPPPEGLPKIYYGAAGPLVLPDKLNLIGEFEAYIRGLPGVGDALGPYAQLTTVSYLWRSRRPEKRAIPDSPHQTADLLERFDESRGVHRRREVVDDARHECVVTVFLKDANYRHTATLMDAMRDYAAERLEPAGMTLRFAGDVAVSQTMIPAIVRTQTRSVLLALAGALLAVSLLRRSLRAGLRIVAPACLAALWVFGLMGWLGVPLGVATSMFCALTLGIGVDYAIHFEESWRRAATALTDAPSWRISLEAARDAGPAIVADTLAIAVGFGLLAFSQVPANARLGLLAAATLLANCVLTLVGMGAALRRRSERAPAPAVVSASEPAS